MPELKNTILESWPALEEDLIGFLSDTDAWIITELKNAQEAKDWEKVLDVIEIMESVCTRHHPVSNPRHPAHPA